MSGAPIQYGFYGRLKARFPSQVVVDITEVCNLACVHCPHPAFRKSEHYGARYLEPDLNAKMVGEVRTEGRGLTQYLRYTSEGEPLVHPHCYDMLEYAVKNSGALVSLTTNGTILNEKRVRRLLESGLDVIDVSIDAYTPETYAKIRINGDLGVTRTNVLRMIDMARGSRTRVVVSFVEQSTNSGEIADFEKFWKDNGAKYVVIRRLHSNAGSLTTVADSIRQQGPEEPRRPCLYPWERITLNPRGYLSFCPQDWVIGSQVADYRTTTIRETWQGEFYRRLREAHSCNDFSSHSFCGNCPDWKQTRWPGQGRSYADMIEEFKSESSE
jgi:MoaA/NifB/PqqE/SkfB family radical SAM enzyme